MICLGVHLLLILCTFSNETSKLRFRHDLRAFAEMESKDCFISELKFGVSQMTEFKNTLNLIIGSKQLEKDEEGLRVPPSHPVLPFVFEYWFCILKPPRLGLRGAVTDLS